MDGSNGTDGADVRNTPDRKAPKALKTARRSTPIHFVISRSCVRVTPPAPKSIENFGFRCFFAAKKLKKVWVKMWVNCLTHTVTHTRGKSRRAPERKLSPFRCSACLRDLSNLRHEAAHFLRGLLLHLSCGVGVGAESESGVVVTEH